MSEPIYLTKDIRRIEEAAKDIPLMERAGAAAAELAARLASDRSKDVLVLAGPGNNGGDARVVAARLQEQFFRATVVGRPEEIPEKNWGLVVDGIFGIGLAREVEGPYARMVDYANRQRCPVLALDVPSGIQSDTGRVMGCAVRATHTVTFISLKPGLLTLDGPDYCGEVHLRTLDVDTAALRPSHGFLIGREILRTALAPRARNSHKGDYGSVGIIGGDHGMVGAAVLAGRAALKLGAGRIYIGMLARRAPLVDARQPELMIRTADEVLKLGHLTALAVGPGLGQMPDAAFYLGVALESQLPLVLDADALNLVAADARLAGSVRARAAPTLLTPHPAEAARLLGTSTREVQNDRVGAATTLAARFNSLAVLKGVGSVCAGPDGTWHINTSGNPGMASAGMGDVLTGIIAALLAQGVDPKTALLAGVYLHGAAADQAVAGGAGPVGLTAGETIDAARAFLDSLTPELKQKVQFPFDADERMNWFYTPVPRKGLTLKEMNEAQRKAAMNLLRAGLSEQGYSKAETIRALEDVLVEMGESPTRRDKLLYYFTVFGEPAPKGSWGWRYEGHHLSQNWTIVNGTALATTPQFFGANPAEVRVGSKKGLRALATEEDL